LRRGKMTQIRAVFLRKSLSVKFLATQNGL
jgi:hypothetical protein